MLTMACGLIVDNCHLLFVVVVFLLDLVSSRSILLERDKSQIDQTINQVLERDQRTSIFDDKNRSNLGELHTYLSNYGYLPRSDLETRAMRTEEEFRSAIRRLQQFASIRVTGQLDKETLDLIRRPRCGLADFDPNRLPRPHSIGNRRKRRYVLQGQKWSKTYLTYKIMNYTPDMPQDSVDQAIYHALLIWSYPSQLRFRQANDLEHPDIEFLFAQGYHKDGYQFDGKGSVLAHAFYPEEHLGGDVHYDEDEDWTVYKENEYGLMDLFSVTVHELGHSLGLMHSNIPDAIMFPYYRGYSKNIKLHSDDIAAIRKLYGDPPTDLLYPTLSNDDSSMTVTHLNISEENLPTDPISTTMLSTNTITTMTSTSSSTTTTTTPTTTTTTNTRSTSLMTPKRIIVNIETNVSLTSILSINEAQIQNEFLTPRPSFARIQNRSRSSHSLSKTSTNHRFNINTERDTSTKSQTISSIDLSTLDICDGFYDAITMYKGILFIFKGQHFWQYDRRGIDVHSPMINNAFWLGLPETLTKVDAAYERADGRLMLFAGRQYWIFDDNRISVEDDGSTYPQNLTRLGLPNHVDHVDAAFFWSYNRQAYIVSSNLYWALDERWNRVNTHDYPRDMTMWQGIETPVDDAFVDLTGSTYFFKGLDFWRLNDTSMEVADDYPRSITNQWLFCDKPRSRSLASSIRSSSIMNIIRICLLFLFCL